MNWDQFRSIERIAYELVRYEAADTVETRTFDALDSLLRSVKSWNYFEISPGQLEAFSAEQTDSAVRTEIGISLESHYDGDLLFRRFHDQDQRVWAEQHFYRHDDEVVLQLSFDEDGNETGRYFIPSPRSLSIVHANPDGTTIHVRDNVRPFELEPSGVFLRKHYGSYYVDAETVSESEQPRFPEVTAIKKSTGDGVSVYVNKNGDIEFETLTANYVGLPE